MELLTWLRTQWDRAGAVALALLGLLALGLGWLGASDTPHLAIQIPYFISGGLTGIFLVGSAAALWLSADMRDEWRELRRLRVLLEEERAERLAAAGAGDKGAPAAPGLRESADRSELSVGRSR